MKVLPEDRMEFSVCKIGDMKFAPALNVWVCLSAFVVESSACPNMIRKLILGVGVVYENAVFNCTRIYFSGK
jgi:hypothetical protein